MDTARHAVGVDDKSLNDFDLGMLLEKGTRLQGGIHDDLRLWTVIWDNSLN